MYIRFVAEEPKTAFFVKRCKAVPADEQCTAISGLCHGLILELRPNACSAQFSLTDKGGSSFKMEQIDFDERLMGQRIDTKGMLEDWMDAILLSPLRLDADDTTMIAASVRHQCMLALDRALLAVAV